MFHMEISVKKTHWGGDNIDLLFFYYNKYRNWQPCKQILELATLILGMEAEVDVSDEEDEDDDIIPLPLGSHVDPDQLDLDPDP